MITDVFCKIIKGELKSDVVYKDDDFWVIKDINPNAPIHLLIIPVKHFESIANIQESDSEMMGKIFTVAHKVAKEIGIADRGYRLIVNEGSDGGKLVPHFHMHLLGGKKLGSKLIKS
jgi:histidine triad (HIT) family protein